ncbi:MAG TPA: hypothetical protein VEJ41_04385 [Candidatus Acidoferrales bacterium]|nr:hypothetical protein [Candidatus Acidoferrales bacterium]
MSYKRVIPFILAIALAACTGQSGSQNASQPAAQQVQRLRQAVAQPMHWVRYTDTAEGAFSMDVPAGWQVDGGMWRFGYFDVRWMMTVRSLDGSMIVRINDASVPAYALPSPHTGSQGQPYVRPRQFQMIVSSYTNGNAYARLYAAHRFKDACKILAIQPGTSWQPAMRGAMADLTGTNAVSDGSATYSCESTNGLRMAVVYARTLQYPVQGGGAFWIASPLVSILAVPQDLPTAYAVAQHMLDSWQKNPQWVAYQQRLTQVGLNEIMSNFQGFLHQMATYDAARRSAMDSQVAGFESRMNAQAQQVSDFGETLTGLQDATDPLTGEKSQVWIGPKSNYYTNGNGVTINSDLSPGPGFHQLNTP